MLEEMASLGYEYVELSHGVRPTLVIGILEALEAGIVKVSSVHNFCPLPPGILNAAPNLHQPSAKRAEERLLWLKQTHKTIEFGSRVGAQVMVSHSGSVPFLFGAPGEDLERMLDRLQGAPSEELEADEGLDAAGKDPGVAHGKAEPAWEVPKYRAKLEKALDKMRRKQLLHVELMLQMYAELLPYSKEHGVRIGVENREAFTELPLDDEFPRLLSDLGNEGAIGYWHDCGHAQLKERLGVIRHEQLLKQSAGRQLGFHMHDVSPDGHDHRPLGSGLVDWEMVRRYVRPQHLVVVEPSPRWPSQSIAEAREFLIELLSR